MKMMAAVGLVLFGYLALAAAQDGPMQVWLLALAPFALIALALVLHITDMRSGRSSTRCNSGRGHSTR